MKVFVISGKIHYDDCEKGQHAEGPIEKKSIEI
jgi:hypothetical protein